MFLGFALFFPPFSIGFVSLLKKNIDGLFLTFFYAYAAIYKVRAMFAWLFFEMVRNSYMIYLLVLNSPNWAVVAYFMIITDNLESVET